MNQESGCTYVHSGTGWDATTATDNCSVAGITYTYTLSGVTTGSGTSLQNVAFAFGETTVTWRATDAAGKYDECSFKVNVSGVTLNGTVKYYKDYYVGSTYNPNLPMNNVTVTLNDAITHNYVAHKVTDVDGVYSFTNLCTGDYEVVITTAKPIGSINATDAAQVNYWNVNRPGGIRQTI
jgi:hypothetical protein